jgi:hypothetical protein
VRAELPTDCHRSLDFRETVATLRLLEGEVVVLFISGGPGQMTADAIASSRIQAKGALRHYDYGGWAEGFAIGDSARVLLYEPDFVDAALTTLDGNAFYSVVIRLVGAAFSIGNPGFHETDEFDCFP